MSAKNVFSVDVETNGKYGEPFSIAAMVVDRGNKELAVFVGRCPIVGSVDNFVQQHVLPELACIPESHLSYDAMLAGFAAFYLQHRKACDVVAHVTYPGEAGMFRDMVEKGLIGTTDGPFPLFDIASMLKHASGSESMEVYFKTHRELLDRTNALYEGNPLNPLRDCASAAVVYNYLFNR